MSVGGKPGRSKRASGDEIIQIISGHERFAELQSALIKKRLISGSFFRLLKTNFPVILRGSRRKKTSFKGSRRRSVFERHPA